MLDTASTADCNTVRLGVQTDALKAATVRSVRGSFYLLQRKMQFGFELPGRADLGASIAHAELK